MTRLLRLWAGALALAAVTLVVPAAADPSYPEFTAPVVDQAHVLSAADVADITRKVTDLQAKSGIQFAIATVPTLDGDEIEPYANALFRRWKLGQKNVNNGLLLLVALKEHKLRFEVGYGLEGTMTDLQSKLIITNTMVPKLKAGDTAGAIKAGVDDALTVLTTDKANWPQRLQTNPDDDDSSPLVIGLVIIVIFVVIVVISRRKGGGWSWVGTGAGFTSGGGSSSSSDTSSGGDSFSGGGGGDSGGGGSSGSW